MGTAPAVARKPSSKRTAERKNDPGRETTPRGGRAGQRRKKKTEKKFNFCLYQIMTSSSLHPSRMIFTPQTYARSNKVEDEDFIILIFIMIPIFDDQLLLLLLVVLPPCKIS